MKKFELFTLSLCHLLVDGISAAVLFRYEGADILTAVLVYNTCAFTTQCITGMIPDRFGRGRLLVLISAVILMAGAALPLPIMAQAIVVGLGNSLFHVSGGYITLKGSRNMTPLGVFVAPGAIGLFVGAAYPGVCMPFACVLVLMAVLVLAASRNSDQTGAQPVAETASSGTAVESASKPTLKHDGTERVLMTALLLIAVAARAVGGSAVEFPWKTTLLASGLMAFSVFLGKSFGGVIADRIGIQKMSIISVAIASVLLILLSGVMFPSLIGQFALNLTMPVTLYLIYRLFPDSPGFAFGLSASALWPGTLLGKLIHLTGIWADMLTFTCFMAGLIAIYITQKELKS